MTSNINKILSRIQLRNTPATPSPIFSLFLVEDTMKQSILVLLLSVLMSTPAMAAVEGLVQLQSPDSVDVTARRLEKALSAKGLRIMAKVDHQKGAAKVDKELRPTMLFIFGNPLAGTPLMQCGQTIGIDLPQKMLVFEDQEGKVWIAYNAPAYLAKRHNLGSCGAKVVAKVTDMLAVVAKAAAGQSEPDAEPGVKAGKK